MTGVEPLAYLVARIFTCGCWLSSGLLTGMHFGDTAKDMARRGIPLSRPTLAIVLVMEFVGTALVLANAYVWAVCLAWGAFLILATLIYHYKFITPQGTIDAMEYRSFWKNFSMLGGLIALMLLDATRPAWLFRG